MNLGEIGWKCMDWIKLAQGRDNGHVLVNTVMALRSSLIGRLWGLLITSDPLQQNSSIKKSVEIVL
jgi:hypothetical protein